MASRNLNGGVVRARVEPELVAAIEQACVEEELTMSQFLRKAVRKELNERNNKKANSLV